MSQENVEIVRRGFEHANRRDLDGFLPYLDPEFELRSAVVGGAEGNVYRGHDGCGSRASSALGQTHSAIFGVTTLELG